MNKKTIIWGAVIVGGVLLVRHMMKKDAEKKAAAAAAAGAANSNASGSQIGTTPCSPASVPNAKCASVCSNLGGTYDPNTRICMGISAGSGAPYFAKGRR